MAAASGDVAYTGAGFKPSAVIAITGMSEAWNTTGFSVGFADASLQAVGLTGSGGTGFYVYNGGYFGGISIAAGTQYLTWKSFDADGLTITYAKVSTPTGTARLHFLFLR